MSNILKQFSDASAALVESAAPRVVSVNGREHGSASGIVVRPGIVVTPEEALERDDGIEIVLAGGVTAKASLAGRDPTTDVAVLRVAEATAAAPVAAARPRAGEVVIGVGRVEANVVAALGSIAWVGEAWRSSQGGLIDAMIRADITLRRPTEGSALLDAEGNLIGMAVFGPRQRVIAIPHATIARAVDQVLAHGSVRRGYAGVNLQPVGGGESGGAIVVGLDPDGPARKAGVLVGDIVVAWNGEAVRGPRAIIDRLGPSSVGSEVRLGVTRGGNPLEVTLTVAPRAAA